MPLGPGPYKEGNEAQDLINIIGPQEADLAAATAALAIDEYAFNYGKWGYDDAWHAIQKFAEVTRRLLSCETVESG